MSTLTRRVVSRVSGYPTAAGFYVPTGVAYDYAIAGLPFLSAASKERPLERVTADYKKQQFDASAEPGEQTLLTWWLRSQSSFHAGTGLKFEDPDPQLPNTVYQFADSRGVDVWTAGQVKMLPATVRQHTAGGQVTVCGAVDGTTDIYLQSDDAQLFRVTASASTSVTWGGGNTIQSLVQDGSNYYAADSVGVWKGTLAGGAGTKIWNTGTTKVVLGWAKQRLMAGVGPKLYELDAAGTGGPTLPTTTPGLKYTHPDPNWQWTSITETPNAILVAGYSGGNSAIYRLTLDTSGAVPVTFATNTAQMPTGEIVHSVLDYLGDYVVIGTNKGVRVATVNASGDLQYGPLTVTSTAPVRALVGKDRFVYAAAENQIDGFSGVWRIDLGMSVEFRRFAYATDLQTHAAGAVRGVALLGTSNRLVIAVDNDGSYLEDPTHLESTGYLQTGKIRMHTLEPKLFKYVRLRAAALAGGLSVTAIAPSGGESSVASYSVAGTLVYDEAPLPSTLGPQEYVSLRFGFTRSAAAPATGPTLNGYQLKVLPAAKRQRTYRLPLLCFDYEKDRHGAQAGGEGTALARLAALEAAEEAGDLVMFQDLTREGQPNRLCVIDQIDMQQGDTPSSTSGWGGYLYVTLRSVT